MSVFVGRRDVVTAAGADAAVYLQGQISQDVDAVAVGESAWSLVLQPQGKVDALFRLTRAEPDLFLLDVEAGFGPALLVRLQRFLLRMDVALEVASWGWHAYRGESIPDAVSVTAPIVAAVDWGEVAGIDVVGPQVAAPDAGMDQLDDTSFRRLRIGAGVPAMGSEIDESTIPAEAGDVHRWASFTKGCYTGQELVARIDSRGSNTPRSLHRLRGEGAPPEPGAVVVADGVGVGSLTSVAPTKSGWVALGYVKRGVDAGAPLAVDSQAAVAEPLRGSP